MSGVPDLDDLLDELESSIATTGTHQPAPAKGTMEHRSKMYSPVPCLPVSSTSTKGNKYSFPSSSSNGVPSCTAPHDEKLSFVEFLKVTAKEAEDLQKLHDDQQKERASKRAKEPPKKIEEKKKGFIDHFFSFHSDTELARRRRILEDTVKREAEHGLKMELEEREREREGNEEKEEIEKMMRMREERERREKEELEALGEEKQDELRKQTIKLQLPSDPPLPEFPDIPSDTMNIEVEDENVEVLVQGLPEPPTHLPLAYEKNNTQKALVVEHGSFKKEERVEKIVQKEEEEEKEIDMQSEEENEVAPVTDQLSPISGDVNTEEFDEVLAYLAIYDGENGATEPVKEAMESSEKEKEEESIDECDSSIKTAEKISDSWYERYGEEERERGGRDEERERGGRDEECSTHSDSPLPLAEISLEKTNDDDAHQNEDGNVAEEVEDCMKSSSENAIIAASPMEKGDESPTPLDTIPVESPIEPPEDSFVDATFYSVDSQPIDEEEDEVEEGRNTMEEDVDLLFKKECVMAEEEVMLIEKNEEKTEGNFVIGEERREEKIIEVEHDDDEVVNVALDEENVEVEEIEGEEEVRECNVVEEMADDSLIVEQSGILEDEEECRDNLIEAASDSMREEECASLHEEDPTGEEHPVVEEVQVVTVQDEPPRPSRARFGDRVVSDVHEIDGDDEEERMAGRLTESQMQLGKVSPFWIPDVDCAACMLCSARFSFLVRRHHCRACGRVLCSACCVDRTVLAYQKDDRKSRVCTPCMTTLKKVEEYEKRMEEERENGRPENGEETAGVSGEGTSQTGQVNTVVKKKSILKVRGASVTSGEIEGGEGTTENCNQPTGGRGVVFRDGVKPGGESTGGSDDERTTAVKPPARKKSGNRKRAAVSRRIAALKVEEHMTLVLPTDERPQIVVVTGLGMRSLIDREVLERALAEGDTVRIVVTRLLTCAIRLCDSPHGEGRSLCVSSHGFHSVGLDEVAFAWRFDESTLPDEENVDNDRRETDEEVTSEEGKKSSSGRKRCPLPMHVIKRIYEIFTASFAPTDGTGDVRRACSRFVRLHSSTCISDDFLPPLTRHTLLFPPTWQSTRGLPLSPGVPLVFAAPVLSCELTWALAAPNRLLLRMGLQSGCYPIPIVIDPHRSPVYSEETSMSVLKMFNDFSSWSYRMQYVPGVTVHLTNEKTVLVLPRSARPQLRKIAEVNKNMLAWLCDINTEADSHLACKEMEDGMSYETNIFQRTDTRDVTGATFVIVDGALKTPGIRVQVSVCEDGVAIRLSADILVELVNALLEGKDFSVSSAGMDLMIMWQTASLPHGSELRSPIDGAYYGDKMQYGLTLERAISSSMTMSSVTDTAVRLSHVFNLDENMIPSEDEAKVFSVAELIANEASSLLDEHLPLLVPFGIETVALRVCANRENFGFDVGEWPGLEEETSRFRTRLDKLISVLASAINYIPHGFFIELHLSIVSTTPLSVE